MSSEVHARTPSAMANPKHAPYGKRAANALKAAGAWGTSGRPFVYGENIAHTAPVVQAVHALARHFAAPSRAGRPAP